MPERTAVAVRDFDEQPAFAEQAAKPPADAAAKLAQARKDLVASGKEPAEATSLKPDETAPGGLYIVGGRLVDAWGQPIDKDKN